MTDPGESACDSEASSGDGGRAGAGTGRKVEAGGQTSTGLLCSGGGDGGSMAMGGIRSITYPGNS